MGKENQEVDAEPRRSLLGRLKYLLNKGRVATSPEKLEQEIHGLVDKGEAQGIISQDEGKMIEAVLELGETTASQIMVPRIDLAMVPETVSITETIRVIIDSGHSRIPVYCEDPDHIKGVIHAKDLFTLLG